MRANKSDLDLYYIGANSFNVIIPEDDLPKGVQVVYRAIKNYVMTTIHGGDLPHFAGFCHLARFSVK